MYCYFLLKPSCFGIDVPLNHWDIGRLINPDEIVINENNFVLEFNNGYKVRYIKRINRQKEGITKKELLFILNNTILRFCNEKSSLFTYKVYGIINNKVVMEQIECLSLSTS